MSDISTPPAAGIVGTPSAGGAGIPSGDAGAAGAGAASADWTAGLDDVTKQFVANKGWKGNADAIYSYQNLEKLHGVPPDRIIKLPGANDNIEEAMGAVYDKLGRPKTAEEYKLNGPDGKPTELSKTFAPVMHKLGLSAKQAEGLTAAWNEHAAAFVKGQGEQQSATTQAEIAALDTEWGAAKEQNMEVAKRGTTALGKLAGKEVDAKAIDALQSSLGYVATMKLMHFLGEKTGEGSFVSPGGAASSGAMTPAAARSEITALGKDAGFMDRLMKGDAETRQRWERLNQYAAPGTTTIG